MGRGSTTYDCNVMGIYQKIKRTKYKIENDAESTGEEIANSITHGMGALLSIVALSILVSLAVRKGDSWRILGFSIYGSALILLYLSSTLYHSLIFTRAGRLFAILDHAFIYILIAGTYTPFALVSIRSALGWTLFGIIWGVAVIGVVFETFIVGRRRVVSTIIYIVMGWMIMAAIKPLLMSISATGVSWLVAGGLLYTLGVIFFSWKRLPYHHMIWHFFVMGGSVCHFFAIYYYVLP